MPITKRFGVRELTDAMEYYTRKTKERITFEYIFFEGVNDTQLEVSSLARIAHRIPSKINVIPFHSIDFTRPSGFAATLRPSGKTESIISQLRAQNLTVIVRSSAGDDIDAACGQLAVQDEEKHRSGKPKRRSTSPPPAEPYWPTPSRVS
jgi:23S rRNA (adenine2503-C2)-methyltransferase